ncbi:MAG: PstS family phosphate ABC transporter substrate-binding protein [Gemmataceae bacterium]|nr:PstS family phosphate ABC transporter substrate-binding protein [Gemmataceae bacterium]
MNHRQRFGLIALGAAVAVVLGFGALQVGAQDIKGEVKIDGSSTVYLITEAVATNFKKLHPGVNVTVGISGTGGGFKKFAAGETDISDASRKIKDVEAANCKKNGIEFTELQIAWDGLAVAIHKENTWATKMTVEQLKKIWHPDTAAQKWSDVDPTWPKEDIQLYGAGPDSGTFDYFTETINGKEKLTRKDYTASEDDNSLVQGVARNKYALGYFGLAYLEGHKDKLVAVALAAKDGKFVEPKVDTVLDRSYPISRPLYIYVANKALARPEVKEFVGYYLRRSDLVSDVKYVPLSALQANRTKKAFEGALKSAAK